MSTVTIEGEVYVLTSDEQRRFDDLRDFGVDETQALQIATGDFEDNVELEHG